jgi:hypothetical protein
MVRKVRKIRPGHRICQMLINACKAGVSMDSILEMFSREYGATEGRPDQGYKASGYANDIRTYDQGILRMKKEGRRVVHYWLENPEEFNPVTGQRWKKEELEYRRNSCYPTDEQIAAMERDSVLEDTSAFIIDPEYVDLVGFDPGYEDEMMPDFKTPGKPFWSKKKNEQKASINLGQKAA